MPVLPLVGSTMVPPGCSSPLASAASTMRTAIRSFTEPPGLRYSTLASTSGASGPRWRVTDDSRTSGVLPTRSMTDSAYCTAGLLAGPDHQDPWSNHPTRGDSAGHQGRGCVHDASSTHPHPRWPHGLRPRSRLHGHEPELRHG